MRKDVRDKIYVNISDNRNQIVFTVHQFIWNSKLGWDRKRFNGCHHKRRIDGWHHMCLHIVKRASVRGGGMGHPNHNSIT